MNNSSTPSKHIRDSIKPRYSLIPLSVLRRVALVYAEGAQHYSDRGWEDGMSYTSVVDHLMEHLTRYWSGDRSEDHLAKAVFGLFALMFYDDRHHEDNWSDMSPMPLKAEVYTSCERLSEALAAREKPF